jgi:hypothetical protein
MYKVIQALMVLHNILLMLGDNAKDILEFDGDDPEAEAAWAEQEQDAHDDEPDPIECFGQQVLQAQETSVSLRRDGQRLQRDILKAIV